MVWHYQDKRPWQSTIDALDLNAEFQRKCRGRLLGASALAFSKAPHISLRIAKRHIGDCLRRWQNEALGPLSRHMSRALTRTSIIRPLQENEWVSTASVTRILAMIRQVEGSARADEIDHLLHTWHYRLRKQNKKPRWDLNDFRRRRGGLNKVSFWRRWSDTHRKYPSSSPSPGGTNH